MGPGRPSCGRIEVAELDGSDRVRASGGVVHRQGSGGTEIVIVHRPRYDDWTIPKGKAEAGESDEECALREVAEETGLRCRLGPELPGAEYVDRKGRPKVVRYWAMRPVGEAEPSLIAPDEVDEVRWVGSDEARRLLSYPRDREILAAFLELG